MKRVAFKMKLYPGFREEYKRRHDAIWPELAKKIKDSGVSDYSIFLDEETNTLFAVQKVSGENGSQDIGGEEIVQKWWKYMADIMETNPDNSHVICQTHWDREHRSNFQETRIELVEMIDRLLDMFDNDPDFHTFIIDGQTVVLEDYLEIKPYNRSRIEKLVKSGKLLIGPWYTLPDHTPSNPESLIRNLLLGSELSHEFGRRMDIGYSIFSFGQIGQLPQIYKNFGINELIFYKGAPLNELKFNEFLWESPDGSIVLASRLGDWFRCNFFVYFTVPVILGCDMNKFGEWKCSFKDKRKLTLGCDTIFGHQPAAELEPDIRIRKEAIPQAIDDVLYSVRNSHSENVKIAMEGIDFSCPVPPLTKAMRTANEMFPEKITLIQSDLKKYFEDFKKDVDLSQLEKLKGEMRYGPIGRIHSETLSTNTHLKQLTARAENMLLHYIEPYATFMQQYGYNYPRELITEAWRYIFKVEAHDSIHGAGDKQIAPNSLYMINQALDIAQGVAKRGFENIIRQINTSESKAGEMFITVFNPLPFEYNGVQRLKINLPREDYAKTFIIKELNGSEVESYIYDKCDDAVASINPENRPKSIFVQTYTADIALNKIPSVGYKTFKIEWDKNETPEESPFGEPYFPYNPIVRPDGVLDNGRLRISINPDCSLRIEDLETGHIVERTHILRDSGDSGNVWVTIEPSFNQIIIPLAGNAELQIRENSSLNGTIDLSYYLELPIAVEKDRKSRRNETIPVKVTISISLAKNSKTVCFKTVFNNIVRDHKLSVLFPTGICTDKSYSDGSFEIFERPLEYRKNHHGHTGDEILRHPMQKFIDLNNGQSGIALFSKGIHEYQTFAIEGKAAVELTLLRSVTQRFPVHGDVFIDFDEHPSQSQGTQTFEYALYFHAGDCTTGKVQREAFSYVISPAVYQHAAGSHAGNLPLTYSFMSKENDVVTLHAIKRPETEEGIIIRLCNPTSQNQNEQISLAPTVDKAWLCQADESIIKPINITNHTIRLQIEPYKIITIQLKLKNN